MVESAGSVCRGRYGPNGCCDGRKGKGRALPVRCHVVCGPCCLSCVDWRRGRLWWCECQAVLLIARRTPGALPPSTTSPTTNWPPNPATPSSNSPPPTGPLHRSVRPTVLARHTGVATSATAAPPSARLRLARAALISRDTETTATVLTHVGRPDCSTEPSGQARAESRPAPPKKSVRYRIGSVAAAVDIASTG